MKEKENDLAGKDEALSKLLRIWKTDAQLPPRFQEAVWQRIERAESSSKPPFWQGLLAQIEAALRRPAAGRRGRAASPHAEDRTAQAKSELRARYVQTVDPYQMPR